ncbi:MAG: type II toxin-antitoxin system RelE/ParE family toxin [Actinomycetota bacterium]|nr:type II toxin-antitoxin system RelE/ParE family toxin [Actinomycetota bacterium]
MARLTLSSRAQRDLKRLDRPDRDRVVNVLREALSADRPPDNLDIRPLTGRAPWLRLRVGPLRVLYRPAPDVPDTFIIERIVHRRDLERAVRQL